MIDNNIVAYPGSPQDGQTRDGSKPIGDMLGYFNNGSGQVQEMAANVNAIQASPKFTVTDPGNIAYASGVTTLDGSTKIKAALLDSVQRRAPATNFGKLEYAVAVFRPHVHERFKP